MGIMGGWVDKVILYALCYTGSCVELSIFVVSSNGISFLLSFNLARESIENKGFVCLFVV